MIKSLVLFAMIAATPALAQTSAPVIPDYGKFAEIADPFEAVDPDLRYRIVFDVSLPARKPGEVHQGLERVARMVNLLARHGTAPQAGDIVVTIHGPAARFTLSQAAFAKRFEGEANPNVELIRQLTSAGVSVRLCGQSMAANGFAREELNPDVRVDVSAITTLATLQLKGYAVIQD
ncbi:MAG: DsrE family protein [Sphingomonadales bacterium]|nr:DsrE family protein [Sphingomonadales bacterium]NCQ19795.1 DsrE family protein [Sphingomonadales bacterium]NCT05054.1 DsrE family protein [Sphingomonadales bacterium]